MFKIFKKSPTNAKPKVGVIEINLVPDVKRELIRNQMMQSRVITGSVLTSMLAAAVVVILVLITFVGQGVMLLTTDNSIKSEFARYKNYPGVDQIITVQNQLANIDATHRDKPITSRLMTILVSVVGGSNNSVKISKVAYDQATRTVTLEGQSTETYLGLERFKKSILATTFELAGNNKNESSDQDQSESTFITNEVLEVEIPSYVDNPGGGKVLVFKVSFVAHDDLFMNSYGDILVKGPGRQDVTDSNIVIPRDVFTPKLSIDKNQLDTGSTVEEAR